MVRCRVGASTRSTIQITLLTASLIISPSNFKKSAPLTIRSSESLLIRLPLLFPAHDFQIALAPPNLSLFLDEVACAKGIRRASPCSGMKIDALYRKKGGAKNMANRYLKIVIDRTAEPLFVPENEKKQARTEPDFITEDGSTVVWLNEREA